MSNYKGVIAKDGHFTMEYVAELQGHITRYENLLQDIYDICLCDRNTKGFDYHEKHPRREKDNGGSRPFTPRDLIENRIGFDWKYEKPSGTCKSWKRLRFLNRSEPTVIKEGK